MLPRLATAHWPCLPSQPLQTGRHARKIEERVSWEPFNFRNCTSGFYPLHRTTSVLRVTFFRSSSFDTRATHFPTFLGYSRFFRIVVAKQNSRRTLWTRNGSYRQKEFVEIAVTNDRNSTNRSVSQIGSIGRPIQPRDSLRFNRIPSAVERSCSKSENFRVEDNTRTARQRTSGTNLIASTEDVAWRRSASIKPKFSIVR